MSQVKPLRATRRRERALATRRRIADSAYELFCEYGYAATTVDMIARAAGVALQTVHYVFRTKGALLQEVVEVAAAGTHDRVPVMERSWIREALSVSDGRRAIALGVEHGVDIYVRVAPLNHALHAAASIEPELEAYLRSIKAARRGGMSRLITALATNEHLHPGLSVERATDLMFVLLSHETYLGLVHDAQWPLEEYKAWLYETLCEQLLRGETRSGASAGAVTRDLTFHSSLHPTASKTEQSKRR